MQSAMPVKRSTLAAKYDLALSLPIFDGMIDELMAEAIALGAANPERRAVIHSRIEALNLYMDVMMGRGL